MDQKSIVDRDDALKKSYRMASEMKSRHMLQKLNERDK